MEKTINLKVVRNVTDTTPNPAPGVVTLKRWGDPLLTQLTHWSTVYEGGNFQHIDLVTIYPDGYSKFGAIDQFQRIPPEGLEYLKSIQPSDGWTLAQKMGWLMNDVYSPPERPYWTRPDGEIRFGLMAFGGQKLLVETANGVKREYTLTIKFPAETVARPAQFYKVIPLPHSMWGQVTHQTHPYWIQRATEAFRTPAPDTYGENPKGVIYHPVWDYPANKGTGLYICRDFCVGG